MDEEVEKCGLCEAEMDVSALGPFQRVICPSCGGEMRVKRRFGHYELLERHAYGGMSIVFLARDLTLGREVAVKVLNDTYSGDEERALLFETEARQTAKVSHPNVVRVYSVGRAYGRFYIAMELVQGTSLEARLDQGERFSEREGLELGVQVVEGLQAAKSAGLLHRDIKPGNLLVDEQGTVKIVDFGLSLVTHGGLAKAKEVFGTPFYAPPESLEVKVEDLRSDMYALGASLYHVLSGVVPIETQSTATRVLLDAKRQVIPLRLRCPELDVTTASIVDRAMAYSAEERFPDYSSLHLALKDALARLEQRSPVTEERVRRRRGGKAWWIGGLLVLTAALGLLFLRSEESASAAELRKEPRLEKVDFDDGEKARAAGRLYLEGRESLSRGDLLESARVFEEVLRDRHALVKTSVWSGVEAVICQLLLGEPMKALELRKEVLERLDEAGEESIGPIKAALSDWHVGETLPLTELVSEDAEEALLEFTGALWNWAQGEFSTAIFFRHLSLQKFTERAEWVEIYQSWASRLGEDVSLLEDAEPDWQGEGNWAEVLSELEELKTQLQAAGCGLALVERWQDRALALLERRSAR